MDRAPPSDALGSKPDPFLQIQENLDNICARLKFEVCGKMFQVILCASKLTIQHCERSLFTDAAESLKRYGL